MITILDRFRTRQASPAGPDEALLHPVSAEAPAGHDVRYQADYDLIAEARRDEDAGLPRGVWVRDCKRADWPAVQRLCIETLTTRSKDLQVGCWLVEAWVHLEGFPGLARGLAFLAELCTRFWPGLYPAIEPDDMAARVAPLEWLNRELPDVLRSLPIVGKADPFGDPLSWSDYVNAQRLETVRRRDPKSAERAEAGGAVTLARFGASLRATETAELAMVQGAMRRALTELDRLEAALADPCGAEAPGLGAIRAAVEDVAAVLSVELAERQKSAAPTRGQQPAKPPAEPVISPPPAPPDAASPAITGRDQAYALLQETAEYLLATEPHSPVPYIIQRIAVWKSLSLAQVAADLEHEGGDMVLLLQVLGMWEQPATQDPSQDGELVAI